MVTKSIACHIRVRPPGVNDGKVNPEGIKIEGNEVSALNVGGDKRYHFKFDKCHGTTSTQQEVFEHIQPLLEQTYRGINTTIFAYGVTGAGKTHTMQGTQAVPGIIPRTVQVSCPKRSELRSSTLNIGFSYVEILKDEVYDLLGYRAEPRKRDIRMSAEGQNIVADLIIQPIGSQAEFAEIYQAAAKTRKTASTKLNSSSSRSHAILTLYLEIRDIENASQVVSGKICLTDLAGSENNNLTGNDRERMRESSAINTSLTTLGKVVDALNLNTKKGGEGSVFVPYRESKLTRLLQDALGGTSQGLLICCLAPGEKFARDTINTLQFGKKSKSVENRVDVTAPGRRQSEPVRPLNARPIDPTKSFKVHPGNNSTATGLCNKYGPARRVTLGAISTNVRSVRLLTAKGKNGGAGVENEKEMLGLKMSDEQLDQRIQKIVNQEIAILKTTAQEPVVVPEIVNVKPVVNAGDKASLAQATEDVRGLCSMSSEEREKRARVLVAHARKAHHSGDLLQALELYKKAYEHMPENKKLSLRITEIELSLEGILPVPEARAGSTQEKLKEEKGQSRAPLNAGFVASTSIKRSRAHLGSLAELSGELEIEGVSESPAKRGRI
ncbi:hypothetical protein I317_00724 [Kwoniella heveanensis CBS 569]|nr:hypothetical protein I317_00724 [Kwoniella heveanensis CBS 569]